MISKKRNKKKYKELTPLYCDYFCKFASFSVPDSIGACRKEISVYCTLKKKYNNKNSLCLFKK